MSTKQLVQKRTTIKSQLTRLRNNLSEEDETPAGARVKMRKLEEMWVKFEEIQFKILEDKLNKLELETGLEERSKETQQQQLQEESEIETDEFERTYYETAAFIQNVIDEETNQHRGDRQRGQQRENEHRLDVKLPTLKIPEFKGDSDQWLIFKEAYKSMIHRNTGLTDGQKFQYLRSALSGEALQVINSLESSDDNYEGAWDILIKTYENKKLLINSHLNQLLDFPEIGKEKSTSFKKLVVHIRSHLKALKTLELPVEHWDDLLIHLVRSKLDYNTQKDWEEEVNRDKEKRFLLEDFLTFLSERCCTLELIEKRKNKQEDVKQEKSKKYDKRVLVVSCRTCAVCQESHAVYRCPEFLKRAVADRIIEARSRKLCMNCLSTGHYAAACRASACTKCQKKHNTLLHLEASKESINQQNSEHEESTPTSVVTHCIQSKENKPIEESPSSIHFLKNSTTHVILSTALVQVEDAEGNQHVCRILLDPGSQSNLITENLVKKLKLKGIKQNEKISGVNRSETSTSRLVFIKIKSRQTNYQTILECLTLPTITERLPQVKIDLKSIQLPQDIQLADPRFYEPNTIDILVGAGVFWDLLCRDCIKRPKGLPALQKTLLGWIVGGELIQTKQESKSKVCGMIINDNLQNLLERFWEQEEIREEKNFTKEEVECEKQFLAAVTRDDSGRYIVPLPMKPEVILGDSERNARRRLFAIERRFERNAQLKKEYVKFMKDYIEQGHMSLAKEDSKQKETFIIPHQAVIRPDSITTKLRVVFDASSKSSNGKSLNDKLLVGPNLQNDLYSIILRFRSHEYVMTADIAAMFRQILIKPEDRDLQRIFWRENEDLPIKCYRLNTVTYGTGPAPYLAIKCLRELAAAETELQQAAQALKEDFYMDDVLTGDKTLEGAIDLYRQLSKLLSKGQFQLRKWRANDERILQDIVHEKEKTSSLLRLEKDGAVKTLGLLWNAQLDCLEYQVTIEKMEKITKRLVLSRISQIYDPLGLLGPVVINGKCFMQKMWKINVGWDEPLSMELQQSWQQYYGSLKSINGVKILRNINPENLEETFDLIGFGDASEKAFGACVYALSRNKEGVRQSRLITSKSKVAPIKTISPPRLELNAAHLLTKLCNVVRQAYGNKINDIYLWSDSTIVLSWINSPPSIRKTYVANRVTKIQNSSEGVTWMHVGSKDNPADLLSRGISVEEWKNHNLWWHGPDWLVTDNWPQQQAIEDDESEMKSTVVLFTARSHQSYEELINRFSSFDKLIRVIAYCMRMKLKAEGGKQKGNLQVKELQLAEVAVLRMIQRYEFYQEMIALEKQRDLPKGSKLAELAPFLDADHLIRVGGRIQKANISDERKHPVVIPSKHHITHLIFEKEHIRLHHCGSELLLSSVRQRYWPLNGRQTARKIIRRCMSCFKNNPKMAEVLMGNLPMERVRGDLKPFTNTGIDYAGPLQTKESKRRGRAHTYKSWIAVFVCLATKAVHLELVTELTSEAFLAALRRFTARRGRCSQIISDNGTNFVGAARELREVYEFLTEKHRTISEYLVNQRIQWKFIPPRATNFGGLWEAAVKLAKKHLYTVTKGLTLTFEECYTLLVEIESIMNSRPLTPISDDPNNLGVITPGHFLVGESLVAPAEYNLLEVPVNKLSRWQHLQKLRQHFWKRWHQDYLPQLQKRAKWRTPGDNLKIGDLVLIKEDNAPPLKWQTGRVMEVYPGPDEIVRVVLLRTSNGQLKRAVNCLCPLPIQDNDTIVN